MNPLAVNPLAALGGAVLVAAIGFGAGWQTNGWRLNVAAQKERAERAEKTVAAVATRVQENTADEVKHAATNRKIEATKNEELAPVVRRIADAPRLRVGPSICPPVARAPEAESPGGGDAADTGGGVVRQDADDRIRALKVEVENALATGRACQHFVRENNLAP